MVSLQKKNARLIKEQTEEGKARVKAEMDTKVAQDQVRALKKNNVLLAQKSKDEAMLKVKSYEEAEQLTDKLKTMDARLSFMLNKVQADEEQRVKPISGAALQRLAIGDPVRAAPPPRRDA